MQPPLEQSFLGTSSCVERSGDYPKSVRPLQVNKGFSSRASLFRPSATLQLKTGVCYLAPRRSATALPKISSDAQSDRLRFFLRLGRRLLWLFRCWRWTLFKDNLSFPGNVRADDLLSKLLQIEFDIGDSLFQGFVFVWHMFVLI